MVAGILRGLEWLGLNWDEGPEFQSQGIARHQADVDRLLEGGFAYRDFTTSEEIAAVRSADPARAVRYPREQAERLEEGVAEEWAAAGAAHAVRFRMPPGEVAWCDLVHGPTRFQAGDIEDLVLLRSDRTPTYNLAVASDDAHMRITHVIRGDDHISNTPKQILLLKALGDPVPAFAHVPMILGPDGRKLSKRHGTTAVADYEAQGVLSEAMVNFLALLGWSPGTDQGVMSRPELIERFSLDRVLKKASVFDPAKLAWLNGQYLSRTPARELLGAVLAELGTERGRAELLLADDPEWFLGVIDLLKTRARTPGDIASRLRIFVEPSVQREPDAVERYWADIPNTLSTLVAVEECLSVTAWDEESLESALRGLAAERGVGAANLIHPLRVALTGQAVSPGIFEVLWFLGRDLAIQRVRDAIGCLRDMQDRLA
jgi:glutamyl-tRNA synthetase